MGRLQSESAPTFEEFQDDKTEPLLARRSRKPLVATHTGREGMMLKEKSRRIPPIKVK
jgi:hypothetical protein